MKLVTVGYKGSVPTEYQITAVIHGLLSAMIK